MLSDQQWGMELNPPAPGGHELGFLSKLKNPDFSQIAVRTQYTYMLVLQKHHLLILENIYFSSVFRTWMWIRMNSNRFGSLGAGSIAMKLKKFISYTYRI